MTGILFALGVCNSHFKYLLREIIGLHVDMEFTKASYLCEIKDEMKRELIRLWRAEGEASDLAMGDYL